MSGTIKTPTIELDPRYQPDQVEREVTAKWDAAKAWHATPDTSGGGGEPYSIVIPPPNVTAALHLGHALNNTLQDVLVRYHRMRGYNTMWMPGTDHAGIATQTVVEKRVLAEEGKRRTDFERDDFVAKIQAWKDQFEQRITEQLKEMGCSCDWDRQRFTMDPVCAAAVRDAFFLLFKDGLIYRGKRLVNWDPVTQTALADDEVEMEEVDGNFYYMKYPLEDGSGHVTVATTRPETMLGDTAVAVNPEDAERAGYIGRSVVLPIVNRRIPIIGDGYVVIPDPESGDAKAEYASGFLKVTPAHDPNDYDIGLRHDLPVVNVMAPDASISIDHGWSDASDECKPLIGMSREDARKWIVKWFKDQGLMEGVRPYRHAIGHSYRSHVPIEPYLSDQWYVKVTDDRLAGAALRAMNPQQKSDEAPHVHAGLRGDTWEGGLRFYPERYARTFEQWHRNIRDWCISRQLWWGHRIPVWGTEKDMVEMMDVDRFHELIEELMEWVKADRVSIQYRGEFVPLEGIERQDIDLSAFFICVRDPQGQDQPVVSLLEAHGFRRDPDVLDTWFSSALWPISTMGWPDPGAFPNEIPEGDAVLETWNPSTVLSTAREIITLWVSRMVMFNLYFRGRLPFRDVFIHAMILDGFGQKMSKSLGNGVDPTDIIHSHGSDAMRFTLTSMTTHTQDVRMPVDILDPYTGETVHPKYITNKSGHKVAAPLQEHKGKKFASSYGIASGEVSPKDKLPGARNTSEKFDYGRNFANKLWNATRFALGALAEAEGDRALGDVPMGLADRWVLSRTVQALDDVNAAMAGYDFHNYANRLYQYVWNDVCDWYIEAIKPTIRQPAAARSRQVLATVLDVSLRMLHPVMPFVTEKLYEALTHVAPKRGVRGLDPHEPDLLMTADWPEADRALIDRDAEDNFERLRTLVTMIREVRTTNKVPPRETVEVSVKIAAELVDAIAAHNRLVETLANVKTAAIGPDVTKPDGAAVVVRPLAEVYLHHQLDAGIERPRLEKQLADVEKQIKVLEGRLSNESYTKKAPAHLVQETRDKLAALQQEREAVTQQLAELEA